MPETLTKKRSILNYYDVVFVVCLFICRPSYYYLVFKCVFLCLFINMHMLKYKGFLKFCFVASTSAIISFIGIFLGAGTKDSHFIL